MWTRRSARSARSSQVASFVAASPAKSADAAAQRTATTLTLWRRLAGLERADTNHDLPRSCPQTEKDRPARDLRAEAGPFTGADDPICGAPAQHNVDAEEADALKERLTGVRVASRPLTTSCPPRSMIAIPVRTTLKTSTRSTTMSGSRLRDDRTSHLDPRCLTRRCPAPCQCTQLAPRPEFLRDREDAATEQDRPTQTRGPRARSPQRRPHRQRDRRTADQGAQAPQRR